MCAVVNVKQLGTRLGSGDGRVSGVGSKGRGGGFRYFKKVRNLGKCVSEHEH